MKAAQRGRWPRLVCQRGIRIGGLRSSPSMREQGSREEGNAPAEFALLAPAMLALALALLSVGLGLSIRVVAGDAAAEGARAGALAHGDLALAQKRTDDLVAHSLAALAAPDVAATAVVRGGAPAVEVTVNYAFGPVHSHVRAHVAIEE